jgi:hypothetical protein
MRIDAGPTHKRLAEHKASPLEAISFLMAALPRRSSGKKGRFSLGVYPEVSLKEARNLRDESCKLLTAGVDPAATSKAMNLARAEPLLPGYLCSLIKLLVRFVPPTLSKQSLAPQGESSRRIRGHQD